jgi:hypothetical protein
MRRRSVPTNQLWLIAGAQPAQRTARGRQRKPLLPMEVPMLHPYLFAAYADDRRAELVRQARVRGLRRESMAAWVDRARAPARVPRHWRWRYRR